MLPYFFPKSFFALKNCDYKFLLRTFLRKCFNIDDSSELDFELSRSDNVLRYVDEKFYSKGHTCRKLSVYVIFVLLKIGFHSLDILLLDNSVYTDKYISYYDLKFLGYSKDEIHAMFYLINHKKIYKFFIKSLIVSNDCPICLESCCSDIKVAHLPCGHFYHDTCILEWWKIKFTCPFCRYCLYPKRIKEWLEENSDSIVYLEIIQQQCRGNVDLRLY